MKIAIVGSGGRLGAALARTYGSQHEIIGLGRGALDLGRAEAVRDVLQKLDFDTLINCAALTDVDYCEAHEEEALQVNAWAVREMAQVCSARKARMIHISTDYVFNGQKRVPYVEEDAPAAISVYGFSKQKGEEELLNASDEHLAVRVSWVFGPDRPSFIDAVVARALAEETVEAIGDKFSAPSYTLDLAEALAPFLGQQTLGGILHLCNKGECTWQQYGQYAIECALAEGLPLRARKVGGLALAEMKKFVAKRPVYTVLSTEKVARLTGTAPRGWQSAVEHYVANHLAPRLRSNGPGR